MHYNEQKMLVCYTLPQYTQQVINSMEEKFDKKSEKSETSVSAPTIGVVLARTLLDELNADRLPESAEGNKAKWVQELCPTVPSRGGKIAFQQKEGEDVPKFEFSPALSSGPSEDDCKRLFCMVHGEFVPSGCTASEHAYPYAKMRENQEHLLDFLNLAENKEIAAAFLSFDGISDYFRYDKDDIIKGSTYFYKHCYNIMDNLFLMCQGCNGSKGNKEPLNWFLEQDSYFGGPFVQHVQNLGGLQKGVIFHRVYPMNKSYLTINLDGEAVYLPDEKVDAKGLGVVIRDWFFEHYQDIFRAHQAFYKENFKPLKEHLEQLGKSFLGEQAEIATELQLRLMKDMKTLANIQGSLLSRQISVLGQAQAGGTPVYSSPSSQDSEEAEFDRIDKTRDIEAFQSQQKASHLVRGLRRIIKRLYGKEVARAIYFHIDATYLRPLVLTGQEWQNIYTVFCQYLADFNTQGKELSAIEQELKLKLDDLHTAEQEKHGVVRAEKLAVERAEREKAQEEILELKRLLAQAQKGKIKESSPDFERSSPPSPASISEEAKILEQESKERKDDKMQVDSPHDERSPPLSPSSTAPAASFFDKEEESKDDRKRKREEDDNSPKHKFGKTGE